MTGIIIYKMPTPNNLFLNFILSLCSLLEKNILILEKIAMLTHLEYLISEFQIYVKIKTNDKFEKLNDKTFNFQQEIYLWCKMK